MQGLQASEKQIKITQFLQKHLGSEVPFEVNEYTIDRLLQLCKLNEQQDKKLQIVINSINAEAKEYKNEAKRLGNIVESMGLSAQNLSKSGRSSLETLVETALILNTADTSLTKLCIELSKQFEEYAKIYEQNKSTIKLRSKLTRKINKTIQQKETLQRAMSHFNETSKRKDQEVQEKSVAAVQFRRKTDDYQKKIQEYEQQLAANKVDPSIYHSALLKKHENLKKLKDDLHPLVAKLDSYYQLPPDLSLAKVKVEELKAQLKTLEEELDKHLNLLDL